MKEIWNKAIKRAPAPGGPRKSARPPAAVEVTSTGALAATGTPPVYGFAPLPAGSVTPGVAEPNIQEADAVAGAIRQALEAVNPPKRAVTLVVPDTAVRVFVLEFDTLPTKQAEALSILRFRLRKMVPFDVEHASIGYQTMTAGKNEQRVLVAVTPGPVLAEYETAVRAAGYEPGAVVPSMLAALESMETPETALVAHLSAEAITTAIVAADDLLLYRTLELPLDDLERATEILRSVAVASAYFEDKTGTTPRQIYSTGGAASGEFALLMAEAGVKMMELVAHPELGAATSLGGASLAAVTGALEGASR